MRAGPLRRHLSAAEQYGRRTGAVRAGGEAELTASSSETGKGGENGKSGRRLLRHDPDRAAVLRTWRRATIASLVVTGVYFFIPLEPEEMSGWQVAGRIAFLWLGLMAVAIIVGRQVRRALQTHRIAERISTLLTVVNIVIVFFSLIYYVSAEQFSGLETRMDALYFSVTTLCTVGFGDITAVSQGARAIVTVQMIFDLVIVTSALSILVGAARQMPPPEPPPSEEPDNTRRS